MPAGQSSDLSAAGSYSQIKESFYHGHTGAGKGELLALALCLPLSIVAGAAVAQERKPILKLLRVLVPTAALCFPQNYLFEHGHAPTSAKPTCHLHQGTRSIDA